MPKEMIYSLNEKNTRRDIYNYLQMAISEQRTENVTGISNSERCHSKAKQSIKKQEYVIRNKEMGAEIRCNISSPIW